MNAKTGRYCRRRYPVTFLGWMSFVLTLLVEPLVAMGGEAKILIVTEMPELDSGPEFRKASKIQELLNTRLPNDFEYYMDVETDVKFRRDIQVLKDIEMKAFATNQNYNFLLSGTIGKIVSNFRTFSLEFYDLDQPVTRFSGSKSIENRETTIQFAHDIIEKASRTVPHLKTERSILLCVTTYRGTSEMEDLNVVRDTFLSNLTQVWTHFNLGDQGLNLVTSEVCINNSENDDYAAQIHIQNKNGGRTRSSVLSVTATMWKKTSGKLTNDRINYRPKMLQIFQYDWEPLDEQKHWTPMHLVEVVTRCIFEVWEDAVIYRTTSGRIPREDPEICTKNRILTAEGG